MRRYSDYYDKEAVAAAAAGGQHRALIGGLWEELGDLQLNFLKAQGLTPIHRLLDVGCGSLRLGVKAVHFLEPGNYWGTDLSLALLDAGYNEEIVSAGLAHKLPRENLVVDEDFSFPQIPAGIDTVIAQSVFTHLPFNHMRLCLVNLARHVKSPCTFYFTVFTPTEGMLPSDSCLQEPGGIVTHPHRDPYHYAVADILYAAHETPWSVQFIGDWGHPRNQQMVKATKL